MSKYNCFFENVDCFLSVRLKSFITFDDRGYYVDLYVNNSDVIHLIKLGVRPYWSEARGHFYVRTAINNNTKIFINGLRLNSLQSEELKYVKTSDITLKEIALSSYKTEFYDRQCYVNKLICSIRKRIKNR